MNLLTKKYFHFFLLVPINLLLCFNSFAQFNFDTWVNGATSGTINNGSCSMAVSISGSNFNPSSPRYNNGIIGTGNGNGLSLDHNWTNTSTSTTVTLTFTPANVNPTFKIEDINRNNPCAAFCSSAWTDQVLVSAGAGKTITATSQISAEQTITGNGSATVTVTGNSVCGGSNGRVDFAITGSVSTLTITYRSGPVVDRTTFSGSPNLCPTGQTNCNSSRGACTDPGRQYITIGSIGSGCTLLPVELTSFTVKCSENYTILNWTTASESDNSHFDIEKSTDAISWRKIGEVRGGGNSSQLIEYEFTDAENNTREVYYRLKQVDHNGTFSYSEIISKECNQSTQPAFNIYPNPVTETIFIQYEFEESQRLLFFNLFDDIGRIIKSASFDLTNKSSSGILQIPVGDLANGIYFMKINSEHNLYETRKLVFK